MRLVSHYLLSCSFPSFGETLDFLPEPDLLDVAFYRGSLPSHSEGLKRTRASPCELFSVFSPPPSLRELPLARLSCVPSDFECALSLSASLWFCADFDHGRIFLLSDIYSSFFLVLSSLLSEPTRPFFCVVFFLLSHPFVDSTPSTRIPLSSPTPMRVLFILRLETNDFRARA